MTPEQIAILRTEVALSTYAGMTDEQAANALNAQNHNADRDVPVVDARRIVLLTGELAAVKLLAEARPVTAITPVAITFVETLGDREAVVPAAAKSGVQTMLGALVAATVLSAGSRNALMALFATQISRAEQLLGRGVRVDPGHVSRARV